tara:strand:- start:45 stop:506 length:462 start_codon:yes stop_codon:yes gene_type:complete
MYAQPPSRTTHAAIAEHAGTNPYRTLATTNINWRVKMSRKVYLCNYLSEDFDEEFWMALSDVREAVLYGADVLREATSEEWGIHIMEWLDDMDLQENALDDGIKTRLIQEWDRQAESDPDRELWADYMREGYPDRQPWADYMTHLIQKRENDE